MLLRLHAEPANAARAASTTEVRFLAVGRLMATAQSTRTARGTSTDQSPAGSGMRNRVSVARVEHDRVDDRDHAAFGLGERQVAEPAHDALRDAGVGDVAPAIGRHRNGATAIDHELHRHATLQVRIVAEPVLVAEAETSEVLADDALDDLGRQAAVDAGRAFADARRLDLVTAAEATATAADALAGSGPRAVTE